MKPARCPLSTSNKLNEKLPNATRTLSVGAALKVGPMFAFMSICRGAFRSSACGARELVQSNAKKLLRGLVLKCFLVRRVLVKVSYKRSHVGTWWWGTFINTLTDADRNKPQVGLRFSPEIIFKNGLFKPEISKSKVTFNYHTYLATSRWWISLQYLCA